MKKLVALLFTVIFGIHCFAEQPQKQIYLWPVENVETGSGILYAPQNYVDGEYVSYENPFAEVSEKESNNRLLLIIVAFACIVVFYAAYLVKAITLRRKGINVARLGRGEKPKQTLRVEIVVALLNYLMPVALVGSILFWDKLAFMPYRVPLLGLIVSSIGVGYFILAITSMRTSWRAGIDATQDTTLITSGIYRISRNPAFVGFDLLYIGITATFPNIVLIVLTLLSIVMFHLLILEEEKYLSTHFGDEYRNYKKATMRY